MRVLISLTAPPNKRYLIIYISILFLNLLFSPHISPHNIDLTTHFPHAHTLPHRCICQQARSGNPRAIQPLSATLGPLKAQQRLGVGYVGCVGLQERHLYSRINFKLNHAAALAEWRQLLSA
jgi:hypothetical protein